MASTMHGSALSGQPALDDAGGGLSGPRRTLAVAVVLASLVLVVLDAAILNVALPTIARELHATAAMSVRIITAYQMGLIMALLPCAALGESLGYRRVFAVGVILFTTASALCALAPSLPWLIAACFIQGLGGAVVMALSVALLRFIVPPRQLGTAIGWNALTVALSYVAGPTLGAVILSRAGWPWLFAMNVPLGIAVVLASGALPYVAGTARRLDITSVALNSGGFAGLVVGAQMLPTRPLLAVVLLSLAAFAFTALVRREMPRVAPLIPLDLLREASFRISVIASICCLAGQMMGLIALPFYLQHELGRSALTTGIYITPWPLAVAVASPLAGRLVNHISTVRLCMAGTAALSMGLVAAALWPLQGGLWPIIPFTALCGFGCGLFQVPNNRTMFLAAPRERSGAAGGMQATARLAGQISGAVIMSMLFSVLSVNAAPRIGLCIAAVLTLTAGFVSMVRR
jgi:DHA2 family multidrug resistance protein-like MFS transporter